MWKDDRTKMKETLRQGFPGLKPVRTPPDTSDRSSSVSPVQGSARPGVAPRGQDIGEAATTARTGGMLTRLRHVFHDARSDLAGTTASDAGSGGGSLLRSFALFVAIPTVLTMAYFIFLAADIYASETRFMVRGADSQEKIGTGALALVSKVAGVSGTSPDSFAVLNYIKSRAIIEDIGGKPMVHRLFAPDRGDMLTTLAEDETWEDIVKYWRRRVIPSIDTQSGIITVEATAFSSEDANWLAAQVVEKSEALVNEISRRSREETLDVAVADVELAKGELASAREALRQYRNARETLDPGLTAESIGEVLSKLMLRRIELEARLGTMQGVIDESFAPRRVLQRELEEVRSQIAAQEALLASRGSEAGTVSDVISGFENLRLEEEFAERRYSIALNAYEAARQEVEKQQLYLVEIVRPAPADTAIYPKKISGTFMIFFGTFVLWSIGSLIAASIRDHAT